MGCCHFPPDMNGKMWCWGGADGLFTEAVNMYVKHVYVDDSGNSSVTEDSPWLITLTGDAARVSKNNHVITVCGAKESDSR